MGEWRTVKFGSLCKISRGASPRPIHDFLGPTGMPWIKIADATATTSKYIYSTKEFIRKEGVVKSVKVHSGDLILTNSATPGLPRFVMIDACIHDGWMLLRDFKGLDKQFAFWLLLNDREKLVRQGNGSVFTNLKTDILRDHSVLIPDEDTQQDIATVLGSSAESVGKFQEIRT